MAKFVKLKKADVVVGGLQIVSGMASDYGNLGNLVSGDWVLFLADGTLESRDDAYIQANYSAVSDTTTLTGSDV